MTDPGQAAETRTTEVNNADPLPSTSGTDRTR